MQHQATPKTNGPAKKGVVLLNLGSPDSTKVEDVRTYLREFLSDPRVIDYPAPLRAAILNLFILPFRPKKSAEAYKKIWEEDGSPLITTTYKVGDALSDRVDVPVEVGMRYGNPSTEEAIRRLRARGVTEILAIPLYPHYAMSSYETAVAKVQDAVKEVAPEVKLTIQPPYFDDPDYIDALYEVAKPHLESGDYDHILFSYHGIPERHLRKSDPSRCYCLQYEDCCRRAHPAHSVCYRHQTHKTTWELAERAGIPKGKYSISYQSRLGSDPWLEPYTDKELERFPTLGVKKLLVICPAFVSDCLETLEEIGMEGKETFEDAGGKEFTYIPCLNEHERWIDVLEKFVTEYTSQNTAASEVMEASAE